MLYDQRETAGDSALCHFSGTQADGGFNLTQTSVMAKA